MQRCPTYSICSYYFQGRRPCLLSEALVVAQFLLSSVLIAGVRRSSWGSPESISVGQFYFRVGLWFSSVRMGHHWCPWHWSCSQSCHYCMNSISLVLAPFFHFSNKYQKVLSYTPFSQRTHPRRSQTDGGFPGVTLRICSWMQEPGCAPRWNSVSVSSSQEIRSSYGVWLM